MRRLEGNAPTMSRLEQAVRKFATQLRSDFGNEITRDPASFKKHVLRLLRRQLPPRPGRPNDPRIDAALIMVSQGKSLKQVLRSQVTGFDQMDTYSRYLAEKGLRTAIARRCRSRRKRGADQQKINRETAA